MCAFSNATDILVCTWIQLICYMYLYHSQAAVERRRLRHLPPIKRRLRLCYTAPPIQVSDLRLPGPDGDKPDYVEAVEDVFRFIEPLPPRKTLVRRILRFVSRRVMRMTRRF